MKLVDEDAPSTAEEYEEDDASMTPPHVHPLDLTGASIREAETTESGRMDPAPSIVLPNQDAEYITHIALDIGGSLIKLIYFSPDPSDSSSGAAASDPGAPSPRTSASQQPLSGGGAAGPGLSVHDAATSSGSGTTNGSSSRGGRLHFVKFESSRVDDCIDFILAKGLHRYNGKDGQREMRIMATGGGAYKYSDIFKERLGVVLEKEDEMGCLVSGCNFLRKAIHHEAFTYENGHTGFVSNSEDCDLYPYLLVNIGSGVSMLKVTGDSSFERVSGSSLGGGTFWGLCRLLTGRRDFDEMLELSAKGGSLSASGANTGGGVDMLVGDIYGGRDYGAIGLSATTIASSFGKVVSQDKEAGDYDPADIALSLCRMVAYNIGQLAHLNAMRHGIKRIFFGGFFIRGHPYTMETISYAIRFWSKGEMQAMFLRHEGFLGAVGAFLKVHPMTPPGGGGQAASNGLPRKVRARFVERFSMGAPFAGGQVLGPAISDVDGDVSEKVSWVEKFVADGHAAAAAAAAASPAVLSLLSESGSLLEGHAATAAAAATAAGRLGGADSAGGSGSLDAALQGVGSLQLVPRAVSSNVPRTVSLTDSTPVSPASGRDPAARMSLHVGVLHYTPSLEPFPLLAEPAKYEPNTMDLRADGQEEEFCWWLRLLEEQIPTVVEKACASEGGGDASRRRACAFGRALGAHLTKLRLEPGAYGQLGLAELFEMREECLREFGFSDVYRQDKERENAAALAVLPDLLAEMDALPLAERLLATVEGVLAANIFDWGAGACVALYRAGTILEIYRSARLRLAARPWAIDHFDALRDRVLEVAGDDGQGHVLRPPFQRVMMFVDNAGADVVLGMLPFARELLRMGCEVVLAANSLPAINDVTAAELRAVVASAAQHCPVLRAARSAALQAEHAAGGHVPPRHPALHAQGSSGQLPAPSPAASSPFAAAPAPPSSAGAGNGGVGSGGDDTESRSQPSSTPTPSSSSGGGGGGGAAPDEGAARSSFEQQPAGPGPCLGPPLASSEAAAAGGVSGAKLYILANGQGSPCIDFRRVPNRLAEACAGVDLLVIEGMGRTIHTNFNAAFKCDVLKLAMIKTERLAKMLFNGHQFDCCCVYTPAGAPRPSPRS